MYYSSLPLNSLQVLIVDRNPDSRNLLQALFETYGTLTLTVTTADEALEILKQVKPDLLISEIGVPEEDGYSLMRKVKALEKTRQIQIRAITQQDELSRHHLLLSCRSGRRSRPLHRLDGFLHI